MNLPRITIVIANYNYGQHISDAIDSALNQDYKGLINICVVDDGSSDKGAALGERDEGGYSRRAERDPASNAPAGVRRGAARGKHREEFSPRRQRGIDAKAPGKLSGLRAPVP